MLSGSGSNDNNQPQTPPPVEFKFMGMSITELKAVAANATGKAFLSVSTHPVYRASVLQVNSSVTPTPLTFIKATRQMWAEGGMRSLFKGWEPGTSREVIKACIRAPIQIGASKFATEIFPESPYGRAVTIAAAAATVPSGILQSLELYKIRTMSQQEKTTFLRFYAHLWQQQTGTLSERLQGFTVKTYAGYPATVGKEGMMQTVSLCMLPLATEFFAPLSQEHPELAKIAAASTSGITAAVFAAPLDLLKNLKQINKGKEKLPASEAISRLYQAALKDAQSGTPSETTQAPESMAQSFKNFFFKTKVGMSLTKRLLTGVPTKGVLTTISYGLAVYILGPVLNLSSSHGKPPAPPSEPTPPPSRVMDDSSAPAVVEPKQNALLTRFEAFTNNRVISNEGGFGLGEDVTTAEELDRMMTRLSI